MAHEDNGWDEYKLLVLDTIKRMDTRLESIDAKQDTLSLQFSKLEQDAKAAKYFGGLILPAGVALGVSWIGRKLGL